MEEKSPSCKECDMTFSSTSCLKEHKETHHVKNSVVIVESQKVSADKHDQKDPDETQTKEKTFSCKECDKAFSSRGFLQKYERTHPMKNDIADEKSKKIIAGENDETQTEEKTLSCHECKMAFSKKEH